MEAQAMVLFNTVRHNTNRKIMEAMAAKFKICIQVLATVMAAMATATATATATL